MEEEENCLNIVRTKFETLKYQLKLEQTRKQEAEEYHAQLEAKYK